MKLTLTLHGHVLHDREGISKTGWLPLCAADGNVVLTTHRLCWLDAWAAPAVGKSCALALDSVAGAEVRAKHVFAAPRLRLRVSVDAHERPAPADAPGCRECEVRWNIAEAVCADTPLVIFLAATALPFARS